MRRSFEVGNDVGGNAARLYVDRSDDVPQLYARVDQISHLLSVRERRTVCREEDARPLDPVVDRLQVADHLRDEPSLVGSPFACVLDVVEKQLDHSAKQRAEKAGSPTPAECSRAFSARSRGGRPRRTRRPRPPLRLRPQGREAVERYAYPPLRTGVNRGSLAYRLASSSRRPSLGSRKADRSHATRSCRGAACAPGREPLKVSSANRTFTFPALLLSSQTSPYLGFRPTPC